MMTGERLKVGIKESKGFSLVEVLISMAILLVVLGGITSLAVGVIRTSKISKQELAGYSYAQEQLELVRQIRNTNLIDGDKTTKWYSDIDNTDFHIVFDPSSTTTGGNNWKIISGLGSSRVANTEYKYHITVEKIRDTNIASISNEDILKVTSVVEWQERDRDREVELITYLTDWLWGYE